MASTSPSSPSAEPTSSRRIERWALFAGPGLAALTLLLDLAPGQPSVTRMAAVAIWMAIWWMAEAVPLAVTALLPLVLFPALGIQDGKHVAGQYINHVIFLFVGGFVVALAMQRWNLHRRIALFVLNIAGVQPRRMLAGFMISTAFLSMWISNTASAMMMVAIALAVVVELEASLAKEDAGRLSVALFLGVAYGASIGGISTLVGTPPNLSFARIFAILYPAAPEISFASWFAFAFPLSVAFLAITWGYLAFRFCPNRVGLAADHFYKEQQRLGPISFAEWVVLLDFSVMVVLWLTRADLEFGTLRVPGWSNWFDNPEYFNDGSVAIAVAIVLFVVPARTPPPTARNAEENRGEDESRVMSWKACADLPWGVVLLFGGGFAVASGFIDSGLSAWLGRHLQSMEGLPAWAAVLVTSTLLTFLTELTSNTATTEIMLPVVASAANAMALHPLLLMVPATLSCSCAFMLPVATPPNAIVFGSGRVPMGQMIRTGLVLNLVGVVLIVGTIFTLGRSVLDIKPDLTPAWATTGRGK